MTNPEGSVLFSISNNRIYVNLKHIMRDGYSFLWMHVADAQYGAVLYPSKKDLLKLRDELTKVLDIMPDDITDKEDEDDDADEDDTWTPEE